MASFQSPEHKAYFERLARLRLLFMVYGLPYDTRKSRAANIQTFQNSVNLHLLEPEDQDEDIINTTIDTFYYTRISGLPSHRLELGPHPNTSDEVLSAYLTRLRRPWGINGNSSQEHLVGQLVTELISHTKQFGLQIPHRITNSRQHICAWARIVSKVKGLLRSPLTPGNVTPISQRLQIRTRPPPPPSSSNKKVSKPLLGSSGDDSGRDSSSDSDSDSERYVGGDVAISRGWEHIGNKDLSIL